jgi:hypothetical protein
VETGKIFAVDPTDVNPEKTKEMRRNMEAGVTVMGDGNAVGSQRVDNCTLLSAESPRNLSQNLGCWSLR